MGDAGLRRSYGARWTEWVRWERVDGIACRGPCDEHGRREAGSVSETLSL